MFGGFGGCFCFVLGFLTYLLSCSYLSPQFLPFSDFPPLLTEEDRVSEWVCGTQLMAELNMISTSDEKILKRNSAKKGAFQIFY